MPGVALDHAATDHNAAAAMTYSTNYYYDDVDDYYDYDCDCYSYCYYYYYYYSCCCCYYYYYSCYYYYYYYF